MQRKKSYSRDFLYSHRKYALVLVLAGEIVTCPISLVQFS
jgi:hypothetical protein